jgi:hypothetical protein
MPTHRVRLIDSLSITHAAWDVPAVHGVHAMYSVSKVGTARANRGRVRSLGNASLADPLAGLPSDGSDDVVGVGAYGGEVVPALFVHAV